MRQVTVSTAPGSPTPTSSPRRPRFSTRCSARIRTRSRGSETTSASTAADLLSIPDTPGEISSEGVATNVRVGIGYLDAWLRGTGAAAIDNLMEDVATAEISRSQLWQWVGHGRISREQVLGEISRTEGPADAKELFTEVALADEFVEFLTLSAYERL